MVGAFAAERRAIGAALRSDELPGELPAFLKPRRRMPAFVGWLAWTLSALLPLNAAWVGSFAAARAPAWLSWMLPDAGDVLFDWAFDAVLVFLGQFFNFGGDPLIDLLQPALYALLFFVCLGLIAWVVRRRLQHGTTLGLGIVSALVCLPFLAMAPAPSHAFEVRSDDDRVTISAAERIDDTLIVFSENITVDGEVTGDLIAMGKKVAIRGRVHGMLITFANTVEITGSVDETVITAAERIELRGAQVAGNLFAAGSRISADAGSTVAMNIAMAGADLELAGHVANDLYAGGESIWVTGKVGGDFGTVGESIELDSAQVGGDFNAYVDAEENVSISASSTITGSTNIKVETEDSDEFSGEDYIIGPLLQFLAAFVTGLVIFRLFPGMLEELPRSNREAATTFALGALFLIAAPVVAGVMVITLIGAPLGLLSFVLGLFAIYLGSTITAALVGAQIMGERQNRPSITLLVGLVVVFLATKLPIVGGPLWLIATIFGLGMLVRWVRELWLDGDDEALEI